MDLLIKKIKLTVNGLMTQHLDPIKLKKVKTRDLAGKPK